jgi:hypothetical protein
MTQLLNTSMTCFDANIIINELLFSTIVFPQKHWIFFNNINSKI